MIIEKKAGQTNAGRWVLVGGVTLCLLTGCVTATIENVENVPIQMNKADPMLEDVEKAIMRAGSCRRWMEDVESGVLRAGSCKRWFMHKEKPGEIRATFSAPDYSAQVTIFYNTKTYSIRYRDSANLDYAGGKIHKNYNLWVQELDRSIRRELISE